MGIVYRITGLRVHRQNVKSAHRRYNFPCAIPFLFYFFSSSSTTPCGRLALVVPTMGCGRQHSARAAISSALRATYSARTLPAPPKLMQPTQTLEISISVYPSFVYCIGVDLFL